jgi:hypothetical protein
MASKVFVAGGRVADLTVVGLCPVVVLSLHIEARMPASHPGDVDPARSVVSGGVQGVIVQVRLG